MINDADELYEIKEQDAQAIAVVTKAGFQVKAGSIARREIVPSAIDSVQSTRQGLLNSGVLQVDEGVLRCTQDYVFRTPSGAAAQILGRRANGWTEWKRSDGTTLSQVQRISRDPKLPLLDDVRRKQIQEHHQRLTSQGELPSPQQLNKQYALFKERFGPQVLQGLDGEPLLTLMHDLSNRDSLVYWLEYKDDDEFDTFRFGSISGGSAMKFRIFKKKETGTWQFGVTKGNQPQEITTEQAIQIAREHRDQLMRGVSLLNELPEDASDDDYAMLQDQMDELAPDVSRLGFGHKYFSLLFPNKLDDYQSTNWQRYIQLKLLMLPPDLDGRYFCGGRFIAASREAELPIANFGAVLNSLFGNLHRYWRIGTSINGKSFWPEMRDESCVAIGWHKLGDISWVDSNATSRQKLKTLLEEVHPNHHTTIGRDSSQITQFLAEISEGDIVLAADGMTIYGIGRVVGGYEFHASSQAPHRRRVEWINVEEWVMPISSEGLQSTVREIKRHSVNLLAIEQRIQSMTSGNEPPPPPTKRPVRLTGIPGRVQSVLERKGQVILYGPPGTGKTYWAEKTALDLAALEAFGKLFESLDDEEKGIVTGKKGAAGLVRMCCFHPAYGYEDFLEGYRPQTVNGQVSFELRDGVFKKLCRDAAASPEKHFYLIVDEINRGDIPRIFGELLTTLEKDKRDKPIILPVSQEHFSVPRNVHLIGTMNTADRSISLLDAALRRRFGFVELMPDGSVLKESQVGGIPLRAWFEALNARIRENVGRDSRNLQIGHSYLMHGGYPFKDIAALRRAIRDDIIPLLEEYCYEDYSTLAKILGEKIVDVASQRIRHELFEHGQEEAMIQGLLAPCPEISTSNEAIASEESPLDSSLDEGDEA